MQVIPIVFSAGAFLIITISLFANLLADVPIDSTWVMGGLIVSALAHIMFILERKF